MHQCHLSICVFCLSVCDFSHRISAVPRRHHDLTLLQQQEVAAALPAAVDLLDERGQVLQALPPPLLQEEELRGKKEQINRMR